MRLALAEARRLLAEAQERSSESTELRLLTDRMAAVQAQLAAWHRSRRSSAQGALVGYASGYPQWDLESPAESRVLSTATDESRHRIAVENARALYRLT